MDPNTAHRQLSVSMRNRKASYASKRNQCSDHPERFIDFPMVLCNERLCGRHYWEVAFEGNGVRIGATYKNIPRKGKKGLDSSPTAWCLECTSERFTAQHDNSTWTIERSKEFCSNRVGVYLDWPAGTLSFSSVCSGTLKHMHTFDTIFAEPLYAVFYIATESSVTLC